MKSRGDTFFACLIMIWQTAFTITAFTISVSPYLWAKIIGQFLLGINILQWFILEHDFGHNRFFKSAILNNAFGHLASLFSLLPFFPWKNIHHSHHVWTGYHDLDPTQPQKKLSEISPRLIYIINICWKLWIPIFAIAYSASNIWNLKRLKVLYPSQKHILQHWFSVFFILCTFSALFYFFLNFMLTCWLPAFVIYLLIADPLLLSQHTHLDYHESAGKDVRPIKYRLQPAYTRSVVYPRWVSRYILYNFDKHGLHHQYPAVPLYKIANIEPPKENTINWLQWLSIAKRMPAHILIFKSHKDTGISL